MSNIGVEPMGTGEPIMLRSGKMIACRSMTTMEKGLSKGRMAFLVFVLGYPLLMFPLVGLPVLFLSVYLAVTACIQSEKRSAFAWTVLGGFAVLCVAIVVALIYAWITHQL